MLRPTIYRPSPLTGLLRTSGATPVATAGTAPTGRAESDETAPARERSLAVAAA
jgi:hypothetical protein